MSTSTKKMTEEEMKELMIKQMLYYSNEKEIMSALSQELTDEELEKVCGGGFLSKMTSGIIDFGKKTFNTIKKAWNSTVGKAARDALSVLGGPAASYADLIIETAMKYADGNGHFDLDGFNKALLKSQIPFSNSADEIAKIISKEFNRCGN